MISQRVQAASAGLTLGILSLGNGCVSQNSLPERHPEPHYSSLEHCLSSMLPHTLKEVEYKLTDNGWELKGLPQLRPIRPRFGSREELKRWMETSLPLYEAYFQEKEAQIGNAHPLTFETSPYILHAFSSSEHLDEVREAYSLRKLEKQIVGSDLSVTPLDRYVHLVHALQAGIVIPETDSLGNKSRLFIGSEEAVDRILRNE